ncbi:MAG: 50S ribosomal protein L21 [Thermoanaerobaculum sp.]|nr:50S ribosomal protein L21 [Thermoanaerobaculum sp.]
MYAIVEAGGKQHKVEVGQRVLVERVWPNAQPGTQVVFDRVVLVRSEQAVRLGAPTVAGAAVKGTVLRSLRGEKIIVFKKKRRKQYRRTKGHRQELYEVRIDAIEA